MKPIWFSTAIVLFCVGVPFAHMTRAHSAGASFSGFGTPVIDGTLAPGEWDSAARYPFNAPLSPDPGDGLTPPVLLVMNDESNVYLGVIVVGDSLSHANVSILFENDHDGEFEDGDDGLILDSSLGFLDVFHMSQSPEPPDPGGLPPVSCVGFCAQRDTEHGGTQDGMGVVTGNGGFFFFEIAHPLDGQDNSHDFSLAPGGIVGLGAQIRRESGMGPAIEWRLFCGNPFFCADVLVVSAVPEPRGMGFWRNQCRGLGSQDVGTEELERLFAHVEANSGAFPECAGLSCQVLEIEGPQSDMRQKAERQVLALWLNVASGRLPAGTPFSLDGSISATRVREALVQIDTILCDPSANRDALQTIKAVAEALNLDGED